MEELGASPSLPDGSAVSRSDAERFDSARVSDERSLLLGGGENDAELDVDDADVLLRIAA